MDTPDFRASIVIPFFNHERSIGQVVDELRPLQLRCYLVNDGSDARCTPVLAELARAESTWLRLINCQPNQGKGQAVMTGIVAAANDGYTHAAQIDADGQHRIDDLKILLNLARRQPEAVVLGYAVYDRTVPAARHYGRYLTHIWVWINTLSFAVRDSMCGLRVYPVNSTLALWKSRQGRRWLAIPGRMSFDIEILVRLVWRGVSVVNAPVAVTYPTDGVSHFRPWRDNAAISWAHTRLFVGMLIRWPWLLARSMRKWAT
jgi:glycosyltransferase involved in cell wall biosynthesis